MDSAGVRVNLSLGDGLSRFRRFFVSDEYINKECAKKVRDSLNELLVAELEAAGESIEMVSDIGLYDQKSIKNIDLLKHIESKTAQTLYLFKFTENQEELIFKAALLYMNEVVKSEIFNSAPSRIAVLTKKVINPLSELTNSYLSGSLDTKSSDFLNKIKNLNDFFESKSKLDKKFRERLIESIIILEYFEWTSGGKFALEHVSLELGVELLLDCFVRASCRAKST